MTPFLPFFVLVVEGLHVAIQDAIGEGIFQGVKIGNNKLNISHFFYADDIIILGEWDRRNIINMVTILQCFYLVFGLKMSLEKSNIFGIGVRWEEVVNYAQYVGCKPDKLPFIYLGLLVGQNMSRIQGWKPIIDKVKKKLSMWKISTLSVSGRLVLIMSILGAKSTYYMSLFFIPVTVAKILESYRSIFFWGGEEDH